MRPEGHVTLAGAGPGDADHLTLGTLKALHSAQALLYDALVSDDIIALAPQKCVKICVGKRGDRLSVSQEKTNALMVRLARRGLHVVRLKGGDPSIFGRVEEERQHLDQHAIAHKTLPGVTAASAAAAQFSFPLTHRGEARKVMFLTGRGRDGEIDLGDAARDVETSLVFYMASHRAEHIQKALLAAGRPKETHLLLIENAGRPDARAAEGRIADLSTLVLSLAWQGPVLMAVGSAFRHGRLSPNSCLGQDVDHSRIAGS